MLYANSTKNIVQISGNGFHEVTAEGFNTSTGFILLLCSLVMLSVCILIFLLILGLSRRGDWNECTDTCEDCCQDSTAGNHSSHHIVQVAEKKQHTSTVSFEKPTVNTTKKVSDDPIKGDRKETLATIAMGALNSLFRTSNNNLRSHLIQTYTDQDTAMTITTSSDNHKRTVHVVVEFGKSMPIPIASAPDHELIQYDRSQANCEPPPKYEEFQDPNYCGGK